MPVAIGRSGLLTILFLTIFWAAAPLYAGEPGLTALLQEIEAMLVEDQVRYSATIKIWGAQETEYAMTIWMKGRDFVSRVERPLPDRGTVYLNVNRNAWIYYPSIEKTVKSTNKQKILGSDFSFTDLGSVNLLADYDCRIIKLTVEEYASLPYFNREVMAGFPEKGLVIEAVAKEGKTVDYPKIRCFLDAGRKLIREEFYTLSGRLLGILTFEDYGELGGKMKPRRMIMRTAFQQERYTVLIYEEAYYEVEIPPVYFSESYLPRLSRM